MSYSLLVRIPLGIVVFFVARFITTVIYRLYFHPLSKVPGPKLAAATWLYEIYFDLILGRKFFAEITRLHEIYGPLVRINPNEVHVNDPELIDTIYPGGHKKVDKDPYLMSQFGTLHNTSFITMGHDDHRMRRNALNRYFSKQAVSKFESFIRETVDRFTDRLLEYRNDGVIKISAAYSSFTTDVITEYCFEKNFGFIERDRFVPNLQPANDAMGEMGSLLRQAPWLHNVMGKIPRSFMLKMDPGMVDWFSVEDLCRDAVTDAKAKNFDSKPTSTKEYVNVLDELLHSSLPPAEKSDIRLNMEAVVLVMAATETTSWILSVCTFYLLYHPHILSTLEAELLKISPDGKVPSLAKLEALPYFSAVICEALRLGYGPISRLPRIHHEPVELHSSWKGKPVDFTVPGGPKWIVSMSSYDVHNNPSIFPKPTEFIPERWLNEDGTRRKDLEKYLLSFSKGTRNCLGMNLAYAELYILIAAVVLKVGEGMKLYQTDVRDVVADHDVFAMRPYLESQGIRVTIE